MNFNVSGTSYGYHPSLSASASNQNTLQTNQNSSSNESQGFLQNPILMMLMVPLIMIMGVMSQIFQSQTDTTSHLSTTEIQGELLKRLPNNGLGNTVKQLFQQAQTYPPEAQQSEALMARIGTLTQNAGQPVQDIIQGLFITHAIQKLDNISQSLIAISGGLEPESPENHAIQQRIANQVAVTEKLQSELIPLIQRLGITR